MDLKTLSGTIISVVGAVAAVLALIPELPKQARIAAASIGSLILIAGVAIVLIPAGNPVGSGQPTGPQTSAHGLGSPTTVLTPSAEPVTNWVPFGPDVAGFHVEPSGDSVTVDTPTSYYARPLGAFSVQGNICDFDLEFDATVTGDPQSSGFGYGIAPRSNLNRDTPSGWSIQFEWDGAKKGYYYRHVILPAQASQPTDDYFLSQYNPGTVHWSIRAKGAEIAAIYRHKQIPWNANYPTSLCGNGITFRAWGGTAIFENIHLTPSP